MKTSRISGFYKFSVDKRVELVKEFAGLSDEEAMLLKKSLEISRADRMIENVVGLFPIPLGIAVNFLINGKDRMVPMAIEEPSVVAAASNAARMARGSGGFRAECLGNIMIGQIQIKNVEDVERSMVRLEDKKGDLIELANQCDPVLVKFGGGARDMEMRQVDTDRGRMLVLHLLVDTRDAMGANAVNTMCERLAKEIEGMIGGKAVLRIISNLATKRKVRARVVFKKENIGGEKVVESILDAYALAHEDIYRAATHNKGIMNGIDAVAIATGNDWRAIEAGAHAYASLNGRYRPLTKWWKNESGDLEGSIELPMAVGVVGGATRSHPLARVCLKILDVKSAGELACVMASVGLAQNFAALRALATEGIQRGHMELHARNVAIMAGAKGRSVDEVAKRMVEEGKIRVDRAKEILEEIRGNQ